MSAWEARLECSDTGVELVRWLIVSIQSMVWPRNKWMLQRSEEWMGSYEQVKNPKRVHISTYLAFKIFVRKQYNIWRITNRWKNECSNKNS